MKLKMFTLKFSPELDGFDDSALLQFLSNSEVSTVYQHAFEKEGQPYWAILVKYRHYLPGEQLVPPAGAANQAKGQKLAGGKQGGEKKYPSDDLSTEQKQLFENMRIWRYNRAKEIDKPPYMICNNKELEAIIKAMPKDVDALKEIGGLKQATVDLYGQEIVQMLWQQHQ